LRRQKHWKCPAESKPRDTASRLGGDLTDTTSDEAWFYAQGGQRKGPVPADKLRELLAAQTIDGETPIWRKGLADWQPLRTTEIGAQLKDTPPAIAADHVNNGLVWALALAPIAYLFVDLAVLNSQNTHIIQYQDDTPVYDPFFATFILPLTWLIPLLTNAALCLLDTRQLKRAGYSSEWLTLFALLLAPVYLFVRAQRLRQTPTYGFVWIASFIVSIILRAM
jgi:GYF domain 2